MISGQASVPTATSFFFSSRRRHTRWTGDWSSDVCSSDLPVLDDVAEYVVAGFGPQLVDALADLASAVAQGLHAATKYLPGRSEERRVGKECRSRWARQPSKEDPTPVFRHMRLNTGIERR